MTNSNLVGSMVRGQCNVQTSALSLVDQGVNFGGSRGNRRIAVHFS
jgi:hypothetical protein